MLDQKSDKQLDDLLRRVISDAAADEALLNDIADSPSLRWSVQRSIAEGNRSPWPPPHKLFRWLAFSVPVAAVLLIAASAIFLGRQPGQPVSVADVDNASSQQQSTRPARSPEPADLLSVGIDSKAPEKMGRKQYSFAKAKSSRIRERRAVPNPVAKRIAKPAAVSRSEFIALSYLPKPESGQIIQVKVPSSMMVTLGLVASVDKPAALVNAEVILGDDGVSHSIRFIR